MKFGTNKLDKDVDKNINESSSKMLFENCIWLNTKETAEFLRTSPKQIRKWVYQGKLKSYRLFGKSLRFKKKEIVSLIQGG
ncbi:MAG: helix-turn-helix domain-containing protein [Bdellovibrionaceae bacterium]|nr:helix-turn-helix domain-containing protein [Pseudobdellovibrionaceae bacterium]